MSATKTRPFQVGDRARVTTTYRTQPNMTIEGVISEFEPAGFADNGKPFPPYAVVSDDEGNRLTSFPLAFEGNYVEFPDMFRVELLEPAPTDPSTGAVTAPTPSPVGAATPSLVELDRREADQERTQEWERVMGAALEWEYADAYPGTYASKDATEALDDLRSAVRAYRESEAARRAVQS